MRLYHCWLYTLPLDLLNRHSFYLPKYYSTNLSFLHSHISYAQQTLCRRYYPHQPGWILAFPCSESCLPHGRRNRLQHSRIIICSSYSCVILYCFSVATNSSIYLVEQIKLCAIQACYYYQMSELKLNSNHSHCALHLERPSKNKTNLAAGQHLLR